MGSLIWIYVCFFGLAFFPGLLFYITHFFGNFKKRLARSKSLRIDNKIKRERQRAEMEILKKKTDFEIEKQRANMKSKYCPYCGSQHQSNTEVCENCGADL